MKSIENIEQRDLQNDWVGKKRIKLWKIKKYIIIEMRNSTDKGDL